MLKSVNTQIPDNSQPLQKNELRKRIKAGAIDRADRDRQLSEEWFALEEECMSGNLEKHQKKRWLRSIEPFKLVWDS